MSNELSIALVSLLGALVPLAGAITVYLRNAAQALQLRNTQLDQVLLGYEKQQTDLRAAWERIRKLEGNIEILVKQGGTTDG